MEHNENKFVDKVEQGCKNFPQGSFDYLWCKSAESYLNNWKIKSKVTEIWKSYLKNYAKDFISGLKAVKYSKELSFFTSRSQDVKIAMSIFKNQCESLYNYMYAQMTGFSESYVVIEDEPSTEEKIKYHPINRLNTNYTGMAFIMTTYLDDYQKKRPIPKAFDYFINFDEKKGNTPFEKVLDSIFLNKNSEESKRLINTLEGTWTSGSEVENEFLRYIWSKNKIQSKVYAGEYSFMDMMGMDMIIISPNGKWVPVQVKKNVIDCQKTYKYQDNMCENWCVSSVGSSWDIKVYDGSSKIIDHLHCKFKPFNLSFFLENYSVDSMQSFKDSEC